MKGGGRRKRDREREEEHVAHVQKFEKRQTSKKSFGLLVVAVCMISIRSTKFV